MMLEIIFWSSLALIFYTYFGYPALLYLISAFKSNRVCKRSTLPNITIIIAAHNEEKRIKEKIENTLSLDYPPGKLEIIVASDGSTDSTNENVLSYKDKGVFLVAPQERKGKEYVQGLAIRHAKGEIIVFTDTAALLERDALGRIITSFDDQTVGCASSEDKVISDKGTNDGEGIYIKYEMLVRRLESRVNSLVGLTGAFFAVRRELCHSWSTHLPSDFAIVIHSVKQGYRAVTNPKALSIYKSLHSQHEEFQRKIRTVMRGIAVLMHHPEILNPLKYGFFSIQFISHKLLRWLMPFIMLCAFVSNIFLVADSSLLGWLFIGQITFYCLAILGLYVKNLEHRTIFRIPAFWALANVAIAVAWIKYLFGYRAVYWQPSRR